VHIRLFPPRYSAKAAARPERGRGHAYVERVESLIGPVIPICITHDAKRGRMLTVRNCAVFAKGEYKLIVTVGARGRRLAREICLSWDSGEMPTDSRYRGSLAGESARPACRSRRRLPDLAHGRRLQANYVEARLGPAEVTLERKIHQRASKGQIQ